MLNFLENLGRIKILGLAISAMKYILNVIPKLKNIFGKESE
jgi:hypothetical protein